jgi:hypothetical protein
MKTKNLISGAFFAICLFVGTASFAQKEKTVNGWRSTNVSI